MAIEKSKGKYPLKYTFIAIFVFVLISLGVVAAIIFDDVNSVEINNDTMVYINEGWGLNKSAEYLNEQDIIKYPKIFELIALSKNKNISIQPGPVEIKPNMSYDEILAELLKVNRDVVKITIPEGYEIRQIVEVLSNEKLIDKEAFLAELKPEKYDYKFLENIPNREEGALEGYLFPTTYYFSHNATEHDIINEMLKEFDKHFTDEYYKRAEELKMSVDEVVTLASIIEREARNEEDRALISGVFHNRLNQDMKLQSCATVQYILKERKANLSTNDTKIENPYNTYINNGLPVGPIAAPGAECIKAALYPEETEYLYFVVGNDGKHVFSKTHEEHVAAKHSEEQ